MSIKAPVLGIDRGRVSFSDDLNCYRRLKMFWVQKIIIFIFFAFLKSLSVGSLQKRVLIHFNINETQ